MRPGRHWRAIRGFRYQFPDGRWPGSSIRAAPGDGSSSPPRLPAEKAGARPSSAAWPGAGQGPRGPRAEAPAWAPIHSRLAAHSQRLSRGHRRSASALSAPAQPESVARVPRRRAARLAETRHWLRRGGGRAGTCRGGAHRPPPRRSPRLRPRRTPCIHRRKGPMDADAGRATTSICRGPYSSEAISPSGSIGTYRRDRRVGTVRSLRTEKVTLDCQAAVVHSCRRIVAYKPPPE